ncbi:MAG TPA: hypothetical protein VD735_03220 [Candidatus Saccharimonadales bacterium]|nr:hypothetical protein [Candidatus Saccharimonadales bacterium]
MDDPDKIDKILEMLNKGLKEVEWEDAENYHAMVKANVDENGVLGLDFKEVVVTKLFINLKTGEIKMFHHPFARKTEK